MSLTNLQVDALDLLQLHYPPPAVHYMPEVFGLLDDLVTAGKTIAIAALGFYAKETAESAQVAAKTLDDRECRRRIPPNRPRLDGCANPIAPPFAVIRAISNSRCPALGDPPW
jgi:hypothetical protein